MERGGVWSGVAAEGAMAVMGAFCYWWRCAVGFGVVSFIGIISFSFHVHGFSI